jgi:hypothetical protein
MSFHPYIWPNLLITFAKNVKITTNSLFLDKIYTVKNDLAIMGKSALVNLLSIYPLTYPHKTTPMLLLPQVPFYVLT